MTGEVIGYGKSYASFGEIVQGRTLDDTDFLVTLPVNLWCTCELRCSRISGPSTISCAYEKSRLIAERLLVELGIETGYRIEIEFTRNIPIGKGLSSSTADMLSVVRSFQEVFGVLVTETFISNVFAQIEAHDGLHYYMSVIYNHRKGVLLDRLNYIPQFTIIAIDEGGMVDTAEYNRGVAFTTGEKGQYERLLARLRHAFEMKDDSAIAECATESTLLHISRTGNRFLSEVVALERGMDGTLGVLTAHSGSFAGLLLPRATDAEDIKRFAEHARSRLGRDVMVVDTLTMI